MRQRWWGELMNQYLLRRVQLPGMSRLNTETLGEAVDALGGNSSWFWGVPGVFHALASPRSFAPVPAVPGPDEHAEALGYWTPLHNLLLYRLGWSRPDRGLRWWYEAGKPVDDPTLALIAEIWDRDGLLDGYVAWLLGNPRQFLNEGSDDLAFAPKVASSKEDLSPGWRQWLRSTNEQYDEARYPGFNYNVVQGDPLHLTRSGGQQHKPDEAATITVSDPSSRKAVFVAERSDSWYFSLLREARSLPAIGARSWHVDVFVRSIGFMGTYRQSRSTGFWFTGQHRVHSPGN